MELVDKLACKCEADASVSASEDAFHARQRRDPCGAASVTITRGERRFQHHRIQSQDGDGAPPPHHHRPSTALRGGKEVWLTTTRVSEGGGSLRGRGRGRVSLVCGGRGREVGGGGVSGFYLSLEPDGSNQFRKINISPRWSKSLRQASGSSSSSSNRAGG